VNYQSANDEWNITSRPVFAGFPYFHGNNVKLPGADAYNPASPRNTNPLNSGVTDLPPAMAGTLNSMTPVAIGGPIYAYDRNLKSPGKLPPHLHNHWVTLGFEDNRMWFHTLDSNTVGVTRSQRVDASLFPALSLRGPLQGKIGPDGALYLLNYDGFYTTNSPAVVKITYTGACSLTPVPIAGRGLGGARPDIALTPSELIVRESGPYELGLYALSGRRILSLEGKGESRHSFADWRERFRLEKGVYIVRIRTAKAKFSEKVSLF
jgi:hypothetical protein